MSHHAETFTAPLFARMKFAAGIISPKPIAVKSRPRENFAGLERSIPRRASDVQIQPNTGASAMMKSELIDWNQVAGTSQPPTLRLVKSRANRLSDVGACSNAAQKMAAKMKRTKMTAMRFFSSDVSPPSANRPAK